MESVSGRNWEYRFLVKSAFLWVSISEMISMLNLQHDSSGGRGISSPYPAYQNMSAAKRASLLVFERGDSVAYHTRGMPFVFLCLFFGGESLILPFWGESGEYEKPLARREARGGEGQSGTGRAPLCACFLVGHTEVHGCVYHAAEEYDAGEYYAAEGEEEAGHGGFSSRAERDDKGQSREAQSCPEHPRLHPQSGGSLHHRAAGSPQAGHDEKHRHQSRTAHAEGRAEVVRSVHLTGQRTEGKGREQEEQHGHAVAHGGQGSGGVGHALSHHSGHTAQRGKHGKTAAFAQGVHQSQNSEQAEDEAFAAQPRNGEVAKGFHGAQRLGKVEHGRPKAEGGQQEGGEPVLTAPCRDILAFLGCGTCTAQALEGREQGKAHGELRKHREDDEREFVVHAYPLT